jgi:transcription elongation factor Elf1
LFRQAIKHRAERLAATYHYHRCGECKEVSACTDKDCQKTEIECRICHDGDLKMTRPDYWLHNHKAVMQ